MASKRKEPKQEGELPFLELVATTTDDRIELEVGDVRVRLPAKFDLDDLAYVLVVLAER